MRTASVRLPQLEQRGAPNLGLALDAGDIVMAVAGLAHHTLVIEGDRTLDKVVKVDPHEAFMISFLRAITAV